MNKNRSSLSPLSYAPGSPGSFGSFFWYLVETCSPSQLFPLSPITAFNAKPALKAVITLMLES